MAKPEHTIYCHILCHNFCLTALALDLFLMRKGRKHILHIYKYSGNNWGVGY